MKNCMYFFLLGRKQVCHKFIFFIYLFFFFRPYWRCYYSNTDAIIYVVDSMDRDRIGISKQELFSMLEVNLAEIGNGSVLYCGLTS